MFKAHEAFSYKIGYCHVFSPSDIKVAESFSVRNNVAAIACKINYSSMISFFN